MLDQAYANRAMAALLLTLIAAPIAMGQSVQGNSIVGKVRTQSGQAVANVIVELQTGTGILVTQTVTTNEGNYAFTNLGGASYELVVNDVSYQPFAERVELSRVVGSQPGETAHRDIILVAKARPSAPRAGTVFRQDVPEEAARAYRRGLKLIAERKSEEGMAALGEAIKLFPKYFDAHFALSLELLRTRRYDEAIKALDQAREINPRDNRLYHAFGLMLFEQKKYALAARVFEVAGQVDKTNAEAFLMRGAALIELGRLDQAEAELKQADRISEQRLAMVHIHLARVYEKRGERKRAADALEKYLGMNPGAANASAIREAIKKLRSPAS